MPRQCTVRILVCLALGPVLLGGCARARPASTSLPPAVAPAAASTTAIPTAAATLPPLGPVDFPVPAEARQKTPDGVQAFTRYYVRLIDRSGKSQDYTALRALSRNCAACTELAASSDQLKAAGRRWEGGTVSLMSTGSALVTGDTAEISTYLRQAAIAVVDASGTAVPGLSAPEVHLTGGLKLLWNGSDSTWLVTQFDADPV